ncbi:hypothetical protein V6N12_025390 [Hibiscus sabdariffa]|uniref:Protein kinase domain-containing protein n=1 Tax=Hibiscus sabdariffa TaxID=183260 RepID=A0ABR2CIA2_9ROSI
MEETRDDAGPAVRGPSSATLRPLDFIEKFGSASLSSLTASQILWSTGMLSEPIPNGFYSVTPPVLVASLYSCNNWITCWLIKTPNMDQVIDITVVQMIWNNGTSDLLHQSKRLKEIFDTIPTLEELYALGGEGYRADIILVDAEKDKKLSMLKQLIVALVKGLNSNPAAMVKKISEMVSDFHKRQTAESPAKTALEETFHMFENRSAQMLGQIKYGSCRSRAILFKVLADTVGLESKLMVGLPNDGAVESADSYKHMSVIVVLNSVELVVDLVRFPGQLIPRSAKAILMTHISVAVEIDSTENDSCDSPLEPNSPLYGFSERADPDSAEKDENLQFHRKLDGPSNVSGASLRNVMLRSSTAIDGKLSLSHTEPNVTTNFRRRSRRKVIAEQRTASSSPEHPSFRARAMSVLSGNRNSPVDFADGISTSRSEGAPISEARRIRRSVSMTKVIGDDIVSAVKTMNATLKQNCLFQDRREDSSIDHSSPHRNESSNLQKNVSNLGPDGHYKIAGGRSQTSERSGVWGYVANDEMVATWNKVIDPPMCNNNPLFPYPEWNIDFSELTVGTRVGIGFFGEVFRGVWNGTDVAIKMFLEQDLNAESMEDFCNEISILSSLRHPNVILFLGACTKPPQLSLVTEYMEMGSLYFLIHSSGQKKRLSWRRRLKMLRDICRGLMCIHRRKVVHRDLKSSNCLVNKNWTVKICDFGLSRIMSSRPMSDSASAGTPEWIAPELIRNEPFTEKCDVFSLGVIMWELCTLSKPWEGVPPERVVYAVANEGSRLEVPEGPLGRLISDCWAEPEERPSCEEILSRLLDCEYSLC